MNLSGNTVLLTGGGSGIGFALASRLSAAGSKVIIVGRNVAKLEAAKEKCPELIIRGCDISDAEERKELFKWVTAEYPEVNVVINNAGIQRPVNLSLEDNDFAKIQAEINTNLEAPIHLSMLFAPYFVKHGGTIVNVSSRLGIMPAVWVPIYTTTKTGIHFFTRSLRMQLRNTGVKVVEILPPMVDTDLAGPGQQKNGVNVDEFADAVIAKLEAGVEEIGFANSELALKDEYTFSVAMADAERMWDMFSHKNPLFENLL